MDDNHKIEREADEAFAAFRKKWPTDDDAGDPTGAEIWHHAWRASMAAERDRCLNEWNGLLLELRQMAEDRADRGDVFAQRVVALLSKS